MAFWPKKAKAGRFIEVFGLVYGMRSSVNAFCRFPTLCAAMARRVVAVAVGPYVDDYTTVDALFGEGSGQDLAAEIITAMCGVLGEAKHIPLRDHGVMLGVLIRLGALSRTATVHYEPRPETIAKPKHKAAEVLRAGVCTPAEASKLQGIAGWCAADVFGRIGRIGLGALKRRQYQAAAEPIALDEDFTVGFKFLMEVLPTLPAREVRIIGQTAAPTVVYPGASWPEGY